MATSPQETKQFTREQKDIFRLGYLEGVADSQRSQNVMRKANSALLEILNEKDQTQPVTGVLISHEMAHKVIHNAKKGTKNSVLAKKLENRVEQAKKDAFIHEVLDIT